MEIRLLYGNELQQAVLTAHEVFEASVRPHTGTQQEAVRFYQFVRPERLWREMGGRSLFLWGAFENGVMCAVSAIRDNGHIVMLYVRPQYAGRHIGTQLVDTMSTYAANVFGRDRVTISVTPASAASYFYHIGFTLIQESVTASSFVPLERRIWSVPQGGGYGPRPAMAGVGAWRDPRSGNAAAGAGCGRPPVMPAGRAGYVQPPVMPAGRAGYGSRPGGIPSASGCGFWPVESSRGYVPYGLSGGYGPQYRYQIYPQNVPAKPEVTYPARKVPVRRLLALVASVLVICVSAITGVTVYHISVDGLSAADEIPADSTEQDEIIDELGKGREI